MAQPEIHSKLQISQTEDWLFAFMRVLIVAGALLFYLLLKLGLILDDFVLLELVLFLFIIWSALVTGIIYFDARVPTPRTRFWKRLLVGVSLAVDGAFIYYAASYTGGLHSPFFYAVFVLIVFHAYYFPSYLPGYRSKFRWLTSGAVSGLVLFIILYLLLADMPPFSNYHFAIDSFLALILSLTAGILRYRDRQTAYRLRRTNELAKLFRGIIVRVNQMYATEESTSQLLDIFDDLAATIGENLSAMACEVFTLESDGIFIRKGLWFRETYIKKEEFYEVLHPHDTIILGADYKVDSVESGRVGRYEQNHPQFAFDRNPLAEKMAVFLKENFVQHSLFTLILKLKAKKRGVKLPIGIIRVTNRLDTYGDLNDTGFAKDDEYVIQDVAKEISGAIETYQLQQNLNKIVETERYLRKLALKDDLDEIVLEILESMSEMVSSRYAELWTPFEDGFERHQKLVLRAQYPSAGHVLEKLKESEKFIDVKTSLIGKSFFVNDSREKIIYYDSISSVDGFAWRHLVQDFGTKKFIAISLSRGQEVLGVVCLHPEMDFIWKDNINAQLSEFADLAAVSLESARFRRRFLKLNMLRKRLDRLFVKDENLFYHNIAVLVRDVVGAEACSIFMLQEDNKMPLLRGMSEQSDDTQKRTGKLANDVDNHVILQVIEHGQSVVISYQNDKPGKTKKGEKTPLTTPSALMACPIHNSDSEIIAVICCINKSREPNIVTKTFSNTDLELFELTEGIISAILENRLNIMRLEEINNRRRNFLSSVAHEYTSPLQSIRMTAEFLKKYHNNRERLKNPNAQFDFLIEEVDFLNYLTANIRTQFAEGVYEFQPSERVRTSLFKLVEKVQTLLKSQAKEKGLDIRLLGSFPTLEVDKFHLEQVVFNLLVNAIKYTLPTSPHPIIEVICEDRQPHLLLIFRNWGVGVRTDESTRIFDMFTRGAEAHAGSVTGTGLGLYISRKIMHKMGGDLRLTKLGNPTEFTVYLPKYRL
jgi:signal transduction histidine kinase